MKKENNELNIRSSASEYLTYIASMGEEASSVEVRYEDENIWITQKMLATLYDVDVRKVNGCRRQGDKTCMGVFFNFL